MDVSFLDTVMAENVPRGEPVFEETLMSLYVQHASNGAACPSSVPRLPVAGFPRMFNSPDICTFDGRQRE
jgi:hypothetical protein